ncbi:MAG TPA: hypothetical protein P5026_07515 [Kiritimatiellia bacterium]|nr:hypothetical protein [Kiritimatiellia bacterium]HRU69672.1 hypothetical protein [Kiritimatiellia bacterium]
MEAGRCGLAEAEGRIRTAALGFAAQAVGGILPGPAPRSARRAWTRRTGGAACGR